MDVIREALFEVIANGYLNLLYGSLGLDFLSRLLLRLLLLHRLSLHDSHLGSCGCGLHLLNLWLILNRGVGVVNGRVDRCLRGKLSRAEHANLVGRSLVDA